MNVLPATFVKDRVSTNPPRPSGTLVREADAVLPLAKSVVLEMLATPVEGVKDLVSVCVTVPLGVVNERVNVAERAKASPLPKPVASSKSAGGCKGASGNGHVVVLRVPRRRAYQPILPGESGERPPSKRPMTILA